MEINNQERPQPHDNNIERAILASALRFNSISRINDNRVDVDTFYSHIHKKIFNACLDVRKDNKNIDILTIAHKLSFNGVLEEIGGEIFIAELYNSIATDANLDNWIKIHLEFYAKRMMINKCSETLQRCYGDDTTAIDVFNSHRSELGSIESLSCGMVQKPTIDKLKDFLGYIGELQTGEGGHIVEFGISGLDALIQLQLKQMMILGGLSNTGKTRFILCDAIGKLKKGIPSAIFSWENPANIIISGMVSIMTNIPMSLMTQKQALKPSHLSKINDAMNYLKSKSDILHVFGKGDYLHSVQGISAELRRIQDNTGGSIKMAYIDHLQNMRGHTRQARHEQIESNVYGVSNLGSEYNIATMLLTQLNRDKTRDIGGRKPILADAKGSGAIEDGADFVIFLHREDRKEVGNVELEIYSEKVRGVGMFERALNFNTFTGAMAGLVPKYDKSYQPNQQG
jgi:replicative DNA helicase